MNIEAVGSRALTPLLEPGSPGSWPIPAVLERRTQNVAAMPRSSVVTMLAALHRQAAGGRPHPGADPVLKGKDLTYATLDGELFGLGGPKTADIQQGGLGDCYFLASLAAVVADEPNAVQNAIKSNDDGTYSVRFYRSEGKAVWITVDATLPVDKNGNLAYARGVDSDADGNLELWVPIMEKAYAVFKDQYGPSDGVHGYEDLGRGGSASDAILALTGKSARYFSTPSSDSALEDLLSAANDGAEVVVGTKKNLGGGWVGNHAYTVLGTYEENGRVLVRLRNPWGSTEPDEAVADRQNDGVFDIALDDLKDQIKGIHTDAPKKQALNLLDLIARWFR